MADQIVNNLGSPDIVALQEIQDNDGVEGGDNALVSDATQTLQDFVDAIAAAGGPTYEFFDVFAAADAAEFTELQGGVPSGNIRNAFLYNPERVTLEGTDALTPTALTELGVSNPDAFADTRVPLIGEFGFNGETGHRGQQPPHLSFWIEPHFRWPAALHPGWRSRARSASSGAQ